MHAAAFFCVFCLGYLACNLDFNTDRSKGHNGSVFSPQYASQHEIQEQSDLPYRIKLLNKKALEQINRRLNGLPIDQQPIETLKWAASNFRGKWAQVTSFGASGIAIAHMIRSMRGAGRVPIVTIDTLHLFPETHALIERDRRHFGLDGALHVYKTREACALDALCMRERTARGAGVVNGLQRMITMMMMIRTMIMSIIFKSATMSMMM